MEVLFCYYCGNETFPPNATICKGEGCEELICEDCKQGMIKKKLRPFCEICYPEIEDQGQPKLVPNRRSIVCDNCGMIVDAGSFEVPTSECPYCGALFGTAPSGTSGVSGEVDFGPDEQYFG